MVPDPTGAAFLIGHLKSADFVGLLKGRADKFGSFRWKRAALSRCVKSVGSHGCHMGATLRINMGATLRINALLFRASD